MQKKIIENKGKAVIYARYSSDRQREESIEGQLRVCEDFAQKNDLMVVDTYIDRALTARTDRRPAFQKMIADCKKRQFEYILVYKLNRFSRNRYDSAVYKHKIAQYGVKVLSAMERITDDPSGILLESLIEGIAEYYSVELAENVLRGMKENALEGKANGRLPLGYQKGPDGKVIIDPSTAPAVKLIFKGTAAGKRMKVIAEELNAAGYKNASGRPYNPNSFAALIRNKKYIGMYQWADTELEGVIPALIDKATWEKANGVLNSRKHKSNRIRSDQYLLTGRLVCGSCGSVYVGKSGTSHRGTTYQYYCCSNRIKRKGCKGKNFRQDQLESWLAAETIRTLNHPDIIRQLSNQILAVQKSLETEKDPLIDGLSAELKEYQKRLANSIKAIESGIISDTISANIQQYEEKIKILEKQLARAKLKQQPFTLTASHVEFFLSALLDGDPKDQEYRTKLLDILVSRVVLYPNKAEVFYRYQKELPSLPNPVIIREERGSNGNQLVGPLGFEPRTNRL